MKIWIPSRKGVVFTALLGANVIFIRIIGALYYTLEIRNAKYSKIKNDLNDLCVNSETADGCPLCPPDWLLRGDHCYYYSEVRNRTWRQSRDHCKMMRADLLVIKDQEQQFLQENLQGTLRQRGDNTYWIGLHQDGDGWRWVDGEHYNSSLFQISPESSGRCVIMSRSGYYQTSCNSTNRCICLKKAVKS